uniref:Putative transcriptional regulator, GntR family/aminotransferase, classes I and II family protein n=1 Tax=Magnetococcus massalia (strain MO-1) TaxID=451514 RepID=A0A1S7LK24_MAGMO|nr:putative transcriptional regulator, GntR family/aminotransferase, classes I and II family protein [Candidatus Magnetococcus massalia]
MKMNQSTDAQIKRRPSYLQLADQIQQGIYSGTYKPGEKLPSIRVLQRRLNKSVTTITSAFAELERRGLVESRPRSGYFTCAPVSVDHPEPEVFDPEPCRILQGAMTRAVEAASLTEALVPLGGAILDEKLLPLESIRRAVRQVAREQMGEGLSYGPAAGARQMRRMLAQQPWGFLEPPGMDTFIMTNGGMEAISLCLRAITRPGDAVVVESPTFYGFLQSIEQLGLYAVEVPMDPERGMDPADLERALEDRRVKAVVSIPTFQNPTGATIPEENRRAIVELITRRQVPFIEDNIYGDLHYGGQRHTPLKALDREGWVLYCSSFSKVMGPGLRVGFCMPGPRFFDQILALKMGTSLTSSQLTQLTVANLLTGGCYSRQVGRLRRDLASNMQRLRHAVEAQFPAGTRMTRPQGGFTLWVELPEGADGVALYEEALEAGIAIVPGSVCSASGRYRNCIRLSAGALWSARIADAIEQLGRMVAKQIC